MTSANLHKTPLRAARFNDLKFVPRFEYGHMAELAEISSLSDGTLLGTGICRFSDAYIPWTITYDEVLTVISGELKLHANGEVHQLNALDSIWLPAGTELVYESKDALVTYAAYPINWD